jgi:hypothetical protein
MPAPAPIRDQGLATAGDDPSRLEAVAAHLASLGAESRVERNVKRIAPWFVSLAIHLGVIMLALFITWTVTNLPSRQESTLIVADFNALNYGAAGALAKGESSAASGVAAATPADSDLAALPLADLIQQRLGESTAPTVRLDPGAGPSGGSLDRFTPVSGGGSGGGSASFAGASSSSNARRIVYVIDASGSMVSHLQIVVQELARSLAALSPDQSFAIIFFQKNEAIAVPPADRLASATVAAKSHAMKWIGENVVPQGGTNPLVAIDKALAFKPDVVFMLSQNITGYGQFEVDQRDLLAKLDELNPRGEPAGRRKTQINCVQFLDRDPLNTMEIITREHGGPNGYKFLTRKDLGLGEP